MNKISERIYNAIKNANLSYGEVSQLTGIPKSALHRYATGETEKCPISRLVAIAQVTGVSPAYLMGWEDSPEENNLAFKDRINEALAIKKMKAADLARLSGVNEGAISQYRVGAYKATQRTLNKLATALDVSVLWLMGYDVPMERTIADSITPHEQEVITQYRSKPHLQEAVDKLLDVPPELTDSLKAISKDIAQELQSLSSSAKKNITSK